MLDHLSLATHSCFDTFQVRGCHLFGLGLLGHETHEAALVVKGHIDINEASFSLRPQKKRKLPLVRTNVLLRRWLATANAHNKAW